jgi:hypothetical protein
MSNINDEILWLKDDRELTQHDLITGGRHQYVFDEYIPGEKHKSKLSDYHTGDRQAYFTVLKKHSDLDSRGYRIYDCLCDCGKQFLGYQSKTNGIRKISCGCKKIKGTAHIPGTAIYAYMADAGCRGIDWRVDSKYLEYLFWDVQKGKCNLSGVDIKVYERGKYPSFGQSKAASLDRIISVGDIYREGNLQWITKEINMCKHTIPNDDFISICVNIAKHSKKLG